MHSALVSDPFSPIRKLRYRTFLRMLLPNQQRIQSPNAAAAPDCSEIRALGQVAQIHWEIRCDMPVDNSGVTSGFLNSGSILRLPYFQMVLARLTS